MQLKDKTVLVTGASSGIGKSIAIECAKKGAKIIVHYRKNKDGAVETLKEIEKHTSGKIVSADLTKNFEVVNLFKEIEQVDLLVNNAGEATPGDFDNLEVWESQWQNIFMSQVYVTNEFLKVDSSKGLRKIVNISSVYGINDMGNPDFPQYSAAKAAVNSFTYNLAKQFAPGVLVNAVAPGYTWTPPWEGTPKEELAACENLTRIKRFVTPEEVATVVVSILENDAITGEIIRVDGGLHLLNLR